MKIENSFKTVRAGGFTLVEIMVVVAIIGLLMSVATVGISHAVKSAQKQTCMINIEGIEGAKSMWMLENHKGDNDVASEEDLKPILKNQVFPTCPSGGTYSINANSTKATCSIHGTTAAPAGSGTSQ